MNLDRFKVNKCYGPTVPRGHGQFYVYDTKWGMQAGRSHRTREVAQREADRLNAEHHARLAREDQ